MKLLSLSKQNEFIQTLLDLRKTVPNAIIAGGAIRDLYHDKEMSDVDIYIQHASTEIYTTKFWIQQFGLRIDDDSSDCVEQLEGEEGYELDEHIEVVWAMYKNDILYNVIAVDMEPTKYVNDCFDVGLCKTWCDGTKIRLTHDFLHDSKHKTLTVVLKGMEQEEFDYMMKRHVAKLLNKYPDYRLVIPPEYADFYKEYNNTLRI